MVKLSVELDICYKIDTQTPDTHKINFGKIKMKTKLAIWIMKKIIKEL